MSNSVNICFETSETQLRCLTTSNSNLNVVEADFLDTDNEKVFSTNFANEGRSPETEVFIRIDDNCLSMDNLEGDDDLFLPCSTPSQTLDIVSTDIENNFLLRDATGSSCLTVIDPVTKLVSITGDDLSVGVSACFDPDTCTQDCQVLEQSQKFILSPFEDESDNNVNRIVPYRPFDTLFEQIYQTIILFCFASIIFAVVWKYKLLPESFYEFFATKRRKRNDLLDDVYRGRTDSPTPNEKNTHKLEEEKV